MNPVAAQPRHIVPKVQKARAGDPPASTKSLESGDSLLSQGGEFFRETLSGAIRAALADSPLSRPDISKHVSALLGEPVSRHMLDRYAAGSHSIDLRRFAALVQVTGDARLVQLFAELIGHVVVDGAVAGLLEEARLEEELRQLRAARLGRLAADV